MQSNRPGQPFSSYLKTRHSDGIWRRHLHLLALTLVPASLTCCYGPEVREIPESQDVIVKELPETTLTSTIYVDGYTESADVFIYKDSDRTLEFHSRLYSQTSTGGISADLWPGDYTAVVITDSPLELDCKALASFDSIELLCYDIMYDSRVYPVKSCVIQFSAGSDIHAEPKPLRSTVILQDVTNGLPGYTLLESPRIYLENANLCAEVLRTEGFRTKETGLSTLAVPLPCDIGMFTQHPATGIHCYPNDSEDISQTTPRTVFVFECEIKGSTVRFPFTLPPLHRGEITSLSLSIDSENEYFCKVL